MKIQSSKQYGQFTCDISNRTIRSVSGLRASMQQYGFLDAYPIHVVKRGGLNVIIDGQHRFNAAKSLGIEFKYVVTEDKEICIPKINSAGAGAWKLKDYVDSFCNLGNKEYIHLRQFAADSGIPLCVSVAILHGAQGGSAGNYTKMVREGRFRVNCAAKADLVAAIVDACQGIHKFSKNRCFVDAVSKCVLLPEFDAARMVEKILANPGLLRLQPTTDTFLENLEAIYNHRAGKSKALPLRFLANAAGAARNGKAEGSKRIASK